MSQLYQYQQNKLDKVIARLSATDPADTTAVQRVRETLIELRSELDFPDLKERAGQALQASYQADVDAFGRLAANILPQLTPPTQVLADAAKSAKACQKQLFLAQLNQAIDNSNAILSATKEVFDAAKAAIGIKNEDLGDLVRDVATLAQVANDLKRAIDATSS